ncbi:5-formyltetrahydrofolate cyclo-ligase [Phocoenobacter skyensis]|uniref:5-formyltetrahydrofolate cyclo-ligase n=1 Tax=Phocoenobacter skyensis TaxID=97481 RepID=A0A1H7ZZD5_9PAST|nr:5-formyltetrahydrofolate cyclo-ligase [Pasteurella skyensis]MDP8080368.1 5-formyltetrahydrofolate cyclo-ligase [Pasteurella skyensis]MDP8086358.1 5-formyltetrahydrofolate cyclo-ligase [Pasteurella skyensis]MDP8186080.1 5-formyltetrahydrofolate cyclo-ligase [Pasteurella skyensis]SEM63074.1 5-formyltetrahydrofolate cyclo-ligase [Pasteurella skyensis]
MIDRATQRQQLRNQMRIKRCGLSEQQQHQAAQSIIQPALALIRKYNVTKLAFYLPFNGEISPLPLIDELLEQGKQIYLPVLHPFSKGHLLFLEYDKNCKKSLKSNRFGIIEPQLDVRKVLPLGELDIIFAPLVACDKKGNRLGMGGGFYDRTFAQAPSNLISIGLAHQCQQVEELPVESWDMPLDYIVWHSRQNSW